MGFVLLDLEPEGIGQTLVEAGHVEALDLLQHDALAARLADAEVVEAPLAHVDGMRKSDARVRLDDLLELPAPFRPGFPGQELIAGHQDVKGVKEARRLLSENFTL